MSETRKSRRESRNFIFLFLALSGIFFLHFITGCKQPHGEKRGVTAFSSPISDTISFLRKIDSISIFLKTGDLVFRKGNDFASQTFANMNRVDKRFSHVGIICMEKGTPMVYHCLGGSFNPDQKMLREPLVQFLIPEATKAWGIYRIQNMSQNQKVAILLDSLYKLGVPFDLKFDLKTDNRLYCSEMVYKVLRSVVPGIFLRVSIANGIPYVSTETFTQSPTAQQILFCELK
ncbi:MAG: hypothetical protein KIS82_00490 [Ferruginibacter sp.]|nr:hypothetical protein [Bacteroidota bacterium]MCW5915801.1 hypothetical protein [Ferruginibacter sp.]